MIHNIFWSNQMETITVKTVRRSQFVDVTGRVAEFVAREGKEAQAVVLYVPHTTAGVTINENADPSVVTDILGYLEKLIPAGRHFQHSEGNSDAHIKSSLIGASLLVPIENGKMVLGTWQGLFFAEFDGPRTRKLHIKLL